MALYPIEKVLRGEVTGTDTVLSICHFDSSEQREAVCQAGEEGPRQYKGSRNGQEKDEGNIYGIIQWDLLISWIWDVWEQKES